MLNTMNGMQVIVSPHALEETKERLFPENEYRSARVHKKLIKRFGSEFRKRPCIFKMADTIVMHPERYSEFRKSIDSRPQQHSQQEKG